MVITGDDKDVKKPRKVLEIFPDKERVLIEGVNIVTRHTKPSARDTKGGIVKKEAPIHISNVMLWDAKKVKAPRQSVPAKMVNWYVFPKIRRSYKITGHCSTGLKARGVKEAI